MHLNTHIIGTNESAIMAFCDQLSAQNMTTTHPTSDDFFNSSGWSEYDISLNNYEAIAESAALVVCNPEPLTSELARQICYAFTKNKPVVLTDMLAFNSDVNQNLEDIIMRRSRLLHMQQSPQHIGAFLQSLKQNQDYSLTAREQLRIAMACRAYFRYLLQNTTSQLAATKDHAQIA